MQTFDSFCDLSKNYNPRPENRWLVRAAYAVIAFAVLYFGGHVVAALIR